MSYEDRCKLFNIQLLAVRRVRRDLIQEFKVMTAMDTVNWRTTPSIRESRLNRRPQLVREIIAG